VATLFSEGDVYRVRKLERICADFELPVVGGTIIVDLLERIDQLEREVQSLQGFDAED
jgi:chaperone modulatory protein CbpM